MKDSHAANLTASVISCMCGGIHIAKNLCTFIKHFIKLRSISLTLWVIEYEKAEK